jgi:hypothetical protein
MLRRAHHDGRRGIWAALCLVACASASAAATRPSAPSQRIFLTDGTALVSFGEFARANGRVVFTLPIGPSASPDVLQVVTLPEALIDWDRTDRYSDAVRRDYYASTRGEEDYAALTGSVARSLGDMAFAPDVSAKLSIAADIRRQLLEWQAGHFGYRSADVRELTGIVEEAISDVRASSGLRAFDFSLVAAVEPPAEPLLPEPTIQDSIQSASSVARMIEGRRERLTLQEAILQVLDRRRRSLPRTWYGSTRKVLVWSMEREARLDRQYADLAARARVDAAFLALRADVPGLERLSADVRHDDERLGYQRPEVIEGLLATLAARTDGARGTRFALDRWKNRSSAYGAYRKKIESCLKTFGQVSGDMATVKRMSGVDPRRLSTALRRLSAIEVALLPLDPPPDLQPAHDMLLSAVHLMREAVRLWRGAAISGDMNMARNASAAAAGALLLVDTARGRVGEFFRRPVAP